MSIDFEISIGDVGASIERHELENAVESAVEDMVDTKIRDAIDCSIGDHVTSQIESLLEEFIVSNNPCSVGQSFQNAIEHAVNQSKVITGAASGDGVRQIVRAELKSLIGNALAGSIE